MDDHMSCSDDGSEDESSSRKIFIIRHAMNYAALVGQWHEQHMVKEPSIDFTLAREIYIRRLYYGSDTTCKNQLRLSRHCFSVLCSKLKELGLKNSKHITVEEVVAMFLYVISFNLTNRKVGFDFIRSGDTVSRYFHIVLNTILKLGRQYIVQQETVMEGFEDEKWNWFENCLGALDGTHVEVSVPLKDQGRYRNRKGRMTTNVLAVCSRDLRFTYILPGWEGSAADSRVLRDALVRKDPLIVPKDKYFLVDAGYTNGPGFLAPYRGVRYHLNEWSNRGNNPQNPKELYNLRHATARNVIERAFGLFKKRWKILREVSFFDVKTHVKIINACAILHNLIRVEAPNDPLLDEVDAEIQTRVAQEGDVYNEEEVQPHVLGDYHNEMEEAQHSDRIKIVQVTNEWTRFRDNLAEAMFLHYQDRRKL